MKKIICKIIVKNWSGSYMGNNCPVCENIIFYDDDESCWKMRIENTNWNYYFDDFDYEDIPINFCYNCGKDYRNEIGSNALDVNK